MRGPANRGLSRLVVATLAAVTLSLVPVDAWAFVRTTTCISMCNDLCDAGEGAVANDGVCNDGGDGAASSECELGTDCSDCGYRPAPGSTTFHCREGETPKPVAWPTRCVGYHINERGSEEMSDFVQLAETIEASFETWNEVACSYFEAVYAGDTSEDRPGYSTCAENANFVGFVEAGWGARGYPTQALALTSVTFDIRDGVIVDADIEMNSANFTFGRVLEDPVVGNVQDAQNTLTHEVGHFLGLDHARPQTHVGEEHYLLATMGDTSPPRETLKRDLLEDDIAGICAIYPLDEVGSAGACEIANEGYFAAPGIGPRDECPDDDDVHRRQRRCSSAPMTSGLPTALGLLWLAGVRRRR